jgi:anti-sigma B factor antagonist
MPAEVKPIEEVETHATLALKGNVDMAGAWEIESQLIAHTVEQLRHLLVDMSAVDFLGSSGIRVFIRLANSLTRRQKKLVLFAAQPTVEHTLALVGFSSVIPVVPTLNDAKAAIGV